MLPLNQSASSLSLVGRSIEAYVSCPGQRMGQYFTEASCFQFQFPASQTTALVSNTLLQGIGIFQLQFPPLQTVLVS